MRSWVERVEHSEPYTVIESRAEPDGRLRWFKRTYVDVTTSYAYDYDNEEAENSEKEAAR